MDVFDEADETVPAIHPTLSNLLGALTGDADALAALVEEDIREQEQGLDEDSLDKDDYGISTFMRSWESRLAGAVTEGDEIAAFFGAMADDAVAAINAERAARRADALVVDADPTAFPFADTRGLTIVRVMRHAIALSGFSGVELDELFRQAPGTCDALAAGDDVASYYLGRDFTDFLTTCRMVALTFPGEPVRPWWEKPRHGKRLAPLALARTGRLRKPIFDAYRAELHCQGQVVSQLVPALGGGAWVELALSFR